LGLKERALNRLNRGKKAMLFALVFVFPFFGSAHITKELRQMTEKAIEQDSLLPFLNSCFEHILEQPEANFNHDILDLYRIIDPYSLGEQRTMRKHFDHIYRVFRSKKTLDRFWSLIAEFLVFKDDLPLYYSKFADYRLGEGYYFTGNYLQAKRHMNRYLVGVSDSILTKNESLNAWNILALSYEHEGELELAEKYFMKAYNEAINFNVEVWKGILTGNLGWLYVAKGDTAKGVQLLQQDLKISRATKEYANLLNTYSQLGDIYLKQNLYDELLLTADSIAKALEYIKKDAYSYEILLSSFRTYYYFHSKLSRYNGDYKQSLNNLLKRDSVNKILESHDAETTNQSQYRLVDERRRELKINLLKSELDNETLENKFLILGLSASVLIILLLLSLWKSRRDLSERLREQYRVIVNQNKEIESRNQELETIAMKLERGNLEKDRLFTVISHDLRGPSLALKDFFELLVQGHIKKTEFWEMLPNLANSIETMYRNTDQLLKWSRNQLQGINPKPENIDLKKILRECVSSMQKTASNKNVKLVFSTEVSSIDIQSDRQHLGIVLRNLLHNAIKFSMENSAIFIDCYSDNSGQPVVVIRDTGVGISQEVIDNLNDSQMIVSQRGTTGEQGTGLGLLICKEYCIANSIELVLKPIEQRGTEAMLIFKR